MERATWEVELVWYVGEAHLVEQKSGVTKGLGTKYIMAVHYVFSLL
jgi:hypothetical protein